VRKCTGDQLALLGDLGVEAGDFVAIAQDYNQRLLNPTDNQVHALSEHAPRPRRGRGRPKGSKDSKPRKRRSDAGIKHGPR
jgi:hypothetical protein